MRKDGLIICLLIALGFTVGCSQTNTLTPTATGSLLAAAQVKPAASLVDGYKDFKFGMKVSEVIAVKGACKSFDDISMQFGMLLGKHCYEIDTDQTDLQLFFSQATPDMKTGEHVLVAVKVEQGRYDRSLLRFIDQSLTEKYKKTSQWSENELGRLQDGLTARVGSLYAGNQVALIVDTETGPMTPLKIYVEYSASEWASFLHDPYKITDCVK